MLATIVGRLHRVDGQFRIQIASIVMEAGITEGEYNPGFYSAESSLQHAALCLDMIQAIASITDIPSTRQQFILRCLGEYLTNNSEIDLENAVQSLRDVAVDGLYEYIDEQLDARNVLYALLLKYKQRSEWYHRSRLREIADSGIEGKRGERALAIDLQEYVLDQGVEFTVEPTSASGEVDLMLRDSDGRYIIIDAKYIPENADPSSIKERVTSGFNQVSRYCDDYNEPEGFLVSFTRTSTSVRLELDDSDGLRFLRLGGKVVYYISVSIADLPSASRSGRASEVVLSADELVHSANS